jgi:hypothetical protein
MSRNNCQLDEKKQAAEKRREKSEGEDHLLPLNGMGSEAPYSHLLISGTQNPMPRMMDLRPLSSQFTVIFFNICHACDFFLIFRIKLS